MTTTQTLESRRFYFDVYKSNPRAIAWESYDADDRLVAQSSLIDAYEASAEGAARAQLHAGNLTALLCTSRKPSPSSQPQPQENIAGPGIV